MSTPIINFYKKKSVFITGGTGFLGKVLLEKLLYSCKDLGNVFIQIKPKYGKKIDDRMTEILESEVFQRIRNENPSALRKIIPIAGNLINDNLGISDKDLLTLQNTVDIVFHVAATVKLDIELRPAININTRGTQKIVELCKQMRKLQGLVYVSTAYSNCPTKVIQEEVSETGGLVAKVYDFLDTTNEKHSEKLLGESPCAYSYSKLLAEGIVAKEAAEHQLPVAIVRPSLIVASIKEPKPGWTDQWHGTSSVVVSVVRGTMRCMLGNSAIVQDFIPADYAANLCIAAAWDLQARRENGDNKLQVYNCCTGLRNPITQRDFFHTCLKHSKRYFKPVVPMPNVYITKSRYKYNFFNFFLETLPSFVIHIWESISGKKSNSLRFQQGARRVVVAGQYFMLNEFTFIDDNVRKLHQKLDENDVKHFNFDVDNINWNDYLKDYVIVLKNRVKSIW